jgi:hypothetical protein
MLYRRLFAIGLLTVLIMLSTGGVSPAQDPAAETDPVIVALHARVSQFLEGVSAGEAQGAYQELLVGSPLLKQTDAIKEFVQRTNELETKYGRPWGFERISAKRVGKDLVLAKYLYKCESFPIVWYFTFYRTPAEGETATDGGAWRAVIVRFDTQLELLGL